MTEIKRTRISVPQTESEEEPEAYTLLWWEEKELEVAGVFAALILVTSFMFLLGGVAFSTGQKAIGYINTAAKISSAQTIVSSVTDSKISSTVSAVSAKSSSVSHKKSTTTTTTPAASSPYRMGIAYGDTLAYESTAQLDTTFANAKSLGVNWIRFDMAWDDVQPDSSTSYNWSALDNIINIANQYGLKSLPTLSYTPSWARVAGCSGGDKCAPASDAQFAAFAKAAVQRYESKGVTAWEIWNEPNLTTFWQPSPSPAAYTALLAATYPAIKSVDPSATVLSGGLGSLDSYSSSYDQLTFLTDMYNDGAKPYFDAVAYHPYSFPAPPSYEVSWSGWTMMAETPTSIRSIMQYYGDGNKQIWVTEYGAPTNGPGAQATSSDYVQNLSDNYVDDTLQAEMVTQAVAYYKANPWVGSLFWYSYQDLGTSTDTIENFFGLLNYNGTQKPAYTAFKTAIATP